MRLIAGTSTFASRLVPMQMLLVTGLVFVASVVVADCGIADTAERDDITASELVAGAIDLTRGATSYAELSMTIHRPDWERTSSLVAWTRAARMR